MRIALKAFLKKSISDFEALLECERLSGGASQETYRLLVQIKEKKYHFAFRRAVQNVSTIRKINVTQEAQLMQIARRYKVPEPEIIAICDAADGLGEGFVMEWLDGEVLGKRVRTAPALDLVRPKLAFQCGEILAQIHAIGLNEILQIGLYTQTAQQAVDEAYQAYRQFAVPRPMIDYTARWLTEHLPHNVEMTLTHNDFRNGNLMISPLGIIGVLDWELASLSDPMRDLGWLCAHCWRFGGDLPVGGFGHYEDLFDGYRAQGGVIDKERMKFWEVFSSFRWAIICLGMAAAWRYGTDRSVERSAIGRRVSESEMDCANLLIAGDVVRFHPSSERMDMDMPTQEELLTAVRDYLQEQRKTTTIARDKFMFLVSANVLDIVLRQLNMGGDHKKLEAEDLEKILGEKNNLFQQRWMLIKKIQTKQLSLEDSSLKNYLRNQVFRQLLIDQPNYLAVKTALGER